MDLRFYSNAGGTAEAVLTTSRANKGHECLDFADKGAGKAVRWKGPRQAFGLGGE